MTATEDTLTRFTPYGLPSGMRAHRRVIWWPNAAVGPVGDAVEAP